MKVEDTYRWNLAGIPGWIFLELEGARFPLHFSESDLTENQMKFLTVLSAIITLVGKGLLRPEVVDGKVRYHVTELGEEAARRLGLRGFRRP